jgi:hypothetical protein
MDMINFIRKGIPVLKAGAILNGIFHPDHTVTKGSIDL